MGRSQWASGRNELVGRMLVGPDNASQTKHPTSEVTWAGTVQSRGLWPVLAVVSSPGRLAATGCRADGPQAAGQAGGDMGQGR